MILALGVIFPLLTLYGFQKFLFALLHLLKMNGGPDQTDVRLAVYPYCGPLSGNVSDVNAGLNLANIKTIVSFGDSYTDGGRHDGGPLEPAVVTPPSPFAGGRSTNGKVWIEHIAHRINAKFMDYAWSSAVTNITLWPSNPYPRDFIMQTTLFLSQSHKLDPDTTLYTVFFGINDWGDSYFDGNNLPQAAHDLLGQMTLLSQPPTNARNFLVTDVYGLGTHDVWGDAWLQTVFDGLVALRAGDPSFNIAFANFGTIWDGVLGSEPGHRAFGYVSKDACSPGPTTDSACEDPDHHFYWFVRHPSRVTHKIMADYVLRVLEDCRVP